MMAEFLFGTAVGTFLTSAWYELCGRRWPTMVVSLLLAVLLLASVAYFAPWRETTL